jgi:hypothetical protein
MKGVTREGSDALPRPEPEALPAALRSPFAALVRDRTAARGWAGATNLCHPGWHVPGTVRQGDRQRTPEQSAAACPWPLAKRAERRNAPAGAISSLLSLRPARVSRALVNDSSEHEVHPSWVTPPFAPLSRGAVGDDRFVPHTPLRKSLRSGNEVYLHTQDLTACAALPPCRTRPQSDGCAWLRRSHRRPCSGDRPAGRSSAHSVPEFSGLPLAASEASGEKERPGRRHILAPLAPPSARLAGPSRCPERCRSAASG